MESFRGWAEFSGATAGPSTTPRQQALAKRMLKKRVPGRCECVYCEWHLPHGFTGDACRLREAKQKKSSRRFGIILPDFQDKMNRPG
jgi:hypothetical protein